MLSLNIYLALSEQYFKVNLFSKPITRYLNTLNNKFLSLENILEQLSIIPVIVLVICENSFGISNIV